MIAIWRTEFAIVVALAAGLLADAVLADVAEPLATSAPVERPAGNNPLAGLLSKPGAHIERIKALSDNSWLNLGSPAPDLAQGKEGVARGRSWGGRAFAYAPDLEGAFFCGTGIHGYVKPDGHYMDDLWFYDANGNRWLCLYPGADTKTLKLRLDKNGFEVNERGQCIPVSYLSHANSNMTYDANLHKLMIVWLSCPWWPNPLPQRRTWLDQKHPLVKQQTETKTGGFAGPVIAASKHPLYWDVASGKWERRFVEGDGPNPNGALHMIGVAEYSPSLKKVLFVAPSRVWSYDYKANAWAVESDAPATVPKGGWWDNGCYDAKRDRLYFTHTDRKAFMSYDVKAKTWTQIKGDGQPEKLGQSNETCMFYDSANDVLVWHGRDIGDRGHIMVYNIDANKWIAMDRTYPEMPNRRQSMMGFYDPTLNVHFYYLAGDSDNQGATMLAYRYKRVKGRP